MPIQGDCRGRAGERRLRTAPDGEFGRQIFPAAGLYRFGGEGRNTAAASDAWRTARDPRGPTFVAGRCDDPRLPEHYDRRLGTLSGGGKPATFSLAMKAHV